MLALIRFLSRPARFVALLAAYLLVFGAILVTLTQLSDVSSGYGILDFEQGYSTERVREVFGSYGVEGFALYARIQLLDLINPALYSLIAGVITYWLWRDTGPQWLPLLPLMAGLGDYLENLTLFLLARSFPDLNEALVAISSTLSLMKNALMVIGFAPLLIGLLRLALKGAFR